MNKKIVLNFIISLSVCFSGSSQKFNNYQTGNVEIKRNPILSKLFIYTSIKVNEDSAIHFKLIVKNRKQIIRMDSIIIQSNNKSFLLNTPKSDSAYLEKDGSLNIISTHLLDDELYKQFKNLYFDRLIIMVDNRPYLIRFKKHILLD